MTKLLLIDDDQNSNQFLGELLGDRYDIKACINISEALGLMESYRPDVVIVEILMQETSGLNFIFELKKRNVKAIVIAVKRSGRISALFYKEVVNALGVNHFFTKPIQLDQLEQCLQKINNFHQKQTNYEKAITQSNNVDTVNVGFCDSLQRSGC